MKFATQCMFGAVLTMLVIGMIFAPVTRAGPMLFDDGGAPYAQQTQPGTSTAGLAIILDGQLSTVQPKESLLFYEQLIPDVQELISRQHEYVEVPARERRGFPIGTYATATDLGAWRSQLR